MKGENNNGFKRPDFLKDRIRVNPFQPPRPSYIQDRLLDADKKPVEEVKTEEAKDGN